MDVVCYNICVLLMNFLGLWNFWRDSWIIVCGFLGIYLDVGLFFLLFFMLGIFFFVFRLEVLRNLLRLLIFCVNSFIVRYWWVWIFCFLFVFFVRLIVYDFKEFLNLLFICVGLNGFWKGYMISFSGYYFLCIYFYFYI